jgi:integrase
MPIELRHRTYFAYLDIPKDVRPKLGDRRIFRKTLQTDSRSVAERRAAPLIAQWKAEVARLRDEPDYNDAKFWRDALRRAKDESERAAIMDQIDMAAWDIAAVNVDHVGQPLSSDPEAGRFYAEATGNRVPTTEHLDEWIGSLQVKAKTAGMRRAAVERLAAKFPTLQDIDRKEVRRWVTELLAEVKPATVQRMTSDCRNYWRYLVTIEAVPEDSAPFDRLGLKVKYTSWLPYTPQEGARLLKAAEDDAELADLIRLVMYTGARREELCSLKLEHVAGDRFSIVDAKTEAGIRTVPIHRRLTTTIKRLVKRSEDGYLLSGLKPNKNGDRGDVLGKRFTRLKQSLGFSNRHTFHSWRGTVITMLEHAGVPEGTVQDIVGHERSTLTGSTYSGKSTFEMRRAALAKLSYSASDRPEG